MAAPGPAMQNAWSTGCCNCCADMGITYGQNVDRLRGTGFCGPCCAYCCLASLCCPCFIAAGTRTEIRKKYGLKEEPCNDCCMHLPIVSACSICQEAYELKVQASRGNP